MNKISIATFQGDSRACEVYGLYQYDYGQVLRIQDLGLSPAVEIHFSLNEKGGSSITRVGTTKDGVTDVVIPDFLLENDDTAQDYWIYAFVYLTDADSGSTEYKIALKVKSRPRPEAIDRPEDQELFREAIAAVNDAADRAETAEKNAKNSEEESGKNAQRAKESAEAAEKTKKDALEEITQEKGDAVTAIDQKERDSVTKIVQHTDSEIQRIDDYISESENSLEQTINEASMEKQALDGSITAAETAKTNLDSSVEIGKKQDATLNQTIETSSTSKAALDSSILAADSKNTDLSNTVESATTVDTSLNDQIKTGTQLKVDLVASGKQAVQDIQETTNKCLESIPEDYIELTSKVSTNESNIRTKAPAIVRSVTCESGAPVQITGSANAPLQGIKLYGWSTQDGEPSPENPVEIESAGMRWSTGKNLFDERLLDDTSNYDKQHQSSGFWRIAIPVKNEPVTVSIKNTTNRGGYLMTNITGDIGGEWMAHGSATIYLKRTVTLTPTDGFIYLLMSTSVATNKRTLQEVGYIQVEYGTEATDYEPYTGGVPGLYQTNIGINIVSGVNSSNASIPTQNGLPGIPVPSNTAGITYIDSTGQAWISDEIDFGRGKYIQRVWYGEFDGSSDEKWGIDAANDRVYINCFTEKKSNRVKLSNMFDNTGIIIGFSNTYISIFNTGYYDDSLSDYGLANWKARIGANPLVVMTYLDTPIETDLTEAQLQAYKTLTTFNPTSIISNDAGAQMDVDYALDTETYINGLNETCNSNLDKLNETIAENKKSDELTQRRLDALWKLNQGIVYEFQSDDTEAYRKDVPTGGKYALVNMLGGKSIVWGQMVTRGWGATYGTITWIESEKAYEYTYDKLGANNINRIDLLFTKFIKDHVYMFKLGFYSTVEQPCGCSVWDNTIKKTWGSGYSKTIPNTWVTLSLIFTNSDSEYGNSCMVRPYITGDGYSEVGDVVKYRFPMIFDLTQMFGVGNEPSTAEEFEAIFPDDYYPYSEPEVVHAGVSEVENMGKNLFTGFVFGGTNPREESGITNTKEGALYIRSDYIPCEVGKRYVYNIPDGWRTSQTVFIDSEKKFIRSVAAGDRQENFIAVEKAKYFVFQIAKKDTSPIYQSDLDAVSKLMLVEQNTKCTQYSPYSKKTYLVPQAIQNLEGYGWSAGSVYNYVDFENKNFIQNVGCVELGSLDWKKITSSDRHGFYAMLPEKTVYGKNVMDSMGSDLIGTINILWAKSTYLATEYEGMFTCTYNTDNDIVYIFEKYNDMSESVFRQNMSGVILYYELAEPIITDISDCIDEIFKEPFEVETGGTLTFKNSLGDSYRIPVPNSEEYVIKLSEVASDE